jgi:outer membrane receptor protein involved in Fe transport
MAKAPAPFCSLTAADSTRRAGGSRLGHLHFGGLRLQARRRESQQQQQLHIQPEKIKAYEGGYKASFLERQLRISGAGFYYDYENMQLNVFAPVSQQAIVNVPKARSYGAELQADVQLGQLTVNSGFS